MESWNQLIQVGPFRMDKGGTAEAARKPSSVIIGSGVNDIFTFAGMGKSNSMKQHHPIQLSNC